MQGLCRLAGGPAGRTPPVSLIAPASSVLPPRPQLLGPGMRCPSPDLTQGFGDVIPRALFRELAKGALG